MATTKAVADAQVDRTWQCRTLRPGGRPRVNFSGGGAGCWGSLAGRLIFVDEGFKVPSSDRLSS